MNLNTDVFSIFDKKWALLTAGRKEKFNSMTISWGGLGTLWGKPVATVYVKPIRYTHDFMEQSEYFTISFYEETYRKSLGLFGSLSGKDVDKVKAAGFTRSPWEMPSHFGKLASPFSAKRSIGRTWILLSCRGTLRKIFMRQRRRTPCISAK